MSAQGRTYSVSFQDLVVSAAIDLFEVVANAYKPVEIVEVRIGQTSDAGDAEDELLTIEILRGFSTSGSGGTSATGVPMNPADAADAATVEYGNTTLASAGTEAPLVRDAFNVRAGWIYIPTPDARPVAQGIGGDTRIVVRLPDAPADALTMQGTLVYREVM